MPAAPKLGSLARSELDTVTPGVVEPRSFGAALIASPASRRLRVVCVQRIADGRAALILTVA